MTRFRHQFQCIFHGTVAWVTNARTDTGIALFALATTLPLVLFAAQAANAQVCKVNSDNQCSNRGAVCSPVTLGTGPGHCTTGEPKSGRFDCQCVGTVSSGPTFDAGAGCSDRTAQGIIVCTITEPNVMQRETAYTNVQFVPGDFVVVQANGCVQSGGSGSQTWRRYVNPDFDIDPNRTTFHGLIRVPGTKEASDLVQIRTVINRFLQVAGGLPLSDYYLHLGYDDTNYPDNGYYNHDDGQNDQCKEGSILKNNGGPAFVTVTIYRNHPLDFVGSFFDFDVLPNSTPTDPGLDPNGLLYNPYWAWQLRHGKQGIPDTSICHNFSKNGGPDLALGTAGLYFYPAFLPGAIPLQAPDLGDCTDQADASTVDLPNYPNRILCEAWEIGNGLKSFSGHVNWFPVTLEGHAAWGSHDAFSDDDYTFSFTNDNPGSPLSVNFDPPHPAVLHVELDSDETIDHFKSAEWTDLRQTVDNGSGFCPPGSHCGGLGPIQQDFDGHTIVTGMFGLDGEHTLKAELHPLFAMATLRDGFENFQGRETWLMFVRNQGDEGYCSNSIWDAGFEDYTFRLPWRTGMIGFEIGQEHTQFSGSDGTQPPTVTYVRPPFPDAGVYVTFHLGPPVHGSYVFDPGASVPFIDGSLELVWKAGGVIMPPIVGVSPASTGGKGSGVVGRPPISGVPTSSSTAALNKIENEEDDVESLIRSAISKLTPAQRQQVAQARNVAPTHPMAVHRLGAIRPAQELKKAPTQQTIVVARHALYGGPAIRKAKRDAAQMHALCVATDNKPEGLPPSICNHTVPEQAQPAKEPPKQQ